MEPALLYQLNIPGSTLHTTYCTTVRVVCGLNEQISHFVDGPTRLHGVLTFFMIQTPYLKPVTRSLKLNPTNFKAY